MSEQVVTANTTLQVTPEQERWIDELLGEEQRPISPTSEKYRIKHLCLQEKYEHIEAETNVIRHRIQELRKLVYTESRIKRMLCCQLEERGDFLYNAFLEIKDEDPIVPSLFELNQFKDVSSLRLDNSEGASKRKSRSGGSRSRTKAKAKESLMTPEQREEEERAKAKIVFIMNSVFTETAKKNAKIEEEMKTKLASVSHLPGIAGPVPGEIQGQHHPGCSPNTGRLKDCSSDAKKKEPAFIHYKLYNMNGKPDPPPAKRQRTENGVIAGISFSYTSEEDRASLSPAPVNPVRLPPNGSSATVPLPSLGTSTTSVPPKPILSGPSTSSNNQCQ